MKNSTKQKPSQMRGLRSYPREVFTVASRLNRQSGLPATSNQKTSTKYKKDPSRTGGTLLGVDAGNDKSFDNFVFDEAGNVKYWFDPIIPLSVELYNKLDYREGGLNFPLIDDQ